MLPPVRTRRVHTPTRLSPQTVKPIQVRRGPRSEGHRRSGTSGVLRGWYSGEILVCTVGEFWRWRLQLPANILHALNINTRQCGGPFTRCQLPLRRLRVASFFVAMTKLPCGTRVLRLWLLPLRFPSRARAEQQPQPRCAQCAAMKSARTACVTHAGEPRRLGLGSLSDAKVY